MKTLFTILFAFAAVELQAAIYNAATCNESDVRAQFASTVSGDTVQMPAGSAMWTNPLVVPCGVSIIGAGTNATFLTQSNDANGAIVMFACNALTNTFPTRISGFTIIGNTNVNSIDWGCIWMNTNFTSTASLIGNAVPWRIDHIVFNGVPMNNIKVFNVHSGLIDDCVFLNTLYFPGQIIRLTGSDSDFSGSYSWSIPYAYGGTNALYVENCFFTNALSNIGAICDGDFGGSMVFRFNTSYNCTWNNHGTEGTTARSTRSYEIYENFWSATEGNNQNIYAIQMRGGTGVIFSNTIIGYKFIEQPLFKRMNQYCTTVEGASGLSRFDSNSATIYDEGNWAYGTETAVWDSYLTGNFVFSNNPSWTVNQWSGYVIVNTNAPYFVTNDNFAPEYWFGQIVSNTTNALELINPKNSYADQGPQTPYFTLNSGDHYQFRKVYHALDQIGVGSGDYLETTNSGWTFYDRDVPGGAIPPLANESSEPLYFWSNTLNSASSGYSGQVVNFDNAGFFLVQTGRDYFDSAKPGYTPLVYPHPLVSPYTNNPPPTIADYTKTPGILTR